LTVVRSGGGNTRVHPFGNGDTSRVELNSNTVVNVDSVAGYAAAFPGGSVAASFQRGDMVHIRTVVSDPFGSFDISGANLELLDAAGTVQLANAAMAQVADSGTATRTYEYAYTLPPAAALGDWTIRVTAREGTEG